MVTEQIQWFSPVNAVPFIIGTVNGQPNVQKFKITFIDGSPKISIMPTAPPITDTDSQFVYWGFSAVSGTKIKGLVFDYRLLWHSHSTYPPRIRYIAFYEMKDIDTLNRLFTEQSPNLAVTKPGAPAAQSRYQKTFPPVITNGSLALSMKIASDTELDQIIIGNIGIILAT